MARERVWGVQPFYETQRQQIFQKNFVSVKTCADKSYHLSFPKIFKLYLRLAYFSVFSLCTDALFAKKNVGEFLEEGAASHGLIWVTSTTKPYSREFCKRNIDFSEQIGMPLFSILTRILISAFFKHYCLPSSGTVDNKNCDEINKFTLILYRKTHHTIPQ